MYSFDYTPNQNGIECRELNLRRKLPTLTGGLEGTRLICDKLVGLAQVGHTQLCLGLADEVKGGAAEAAGMLDDCIQVPTGSVFVEMGW